MKKRSIEEIRKKIENGSAVVMTAHEFIKRFTNGEKLTFEDVDVVTTATKGLMSGTAAIMAFRVTEPGVFKKARQVLINDIPVYVGPCPNETLGMIDLMLHATDRSISNPKYGAGHLLRELVEGKSVRVNVITDQGRFIERELTLDEMYYAKMLGIRQAFRNYNAFINRGEKKVSSIFSVTGMDPDCSEITICGVGAVNPLENDPGFDVLGIGSPILVNGAIGYIIGTGTRATSQRPNLMTVAPIHDMKPDYMGGFLTHSGPEVINSIGAAIPIINEKVFNNLKRSDEEVSLNVVDIIGRKVLHTSDYSKVWNIKEQNYFMIYNKDACKECSYNTPELCPVVNYCPTGAFSLENGIDRNYCFNCGTCKKVCKNAAFNCNLGEISIEDKSVPITLRQSDRLGAIRMMEELKDLVIKGEFPLVLPTAKPKIYVEKLEKERDIEKK